MKSTLVVQKIKLRRSDSFCLEVENIRLRPGDILCATGPNGSGKTTLIECLIGTLTGGNIHVTLDDHKVTSNMYTTKALIGYIPDDESWFIKELCATEYLNLLMDIYEEVGILHSRMQHRLQYMARILHFSAFDQPLASLSHGNKKKVQIMAGLLHQPKVIVVDELRNGLDPLAIIAAEELIRAEAARGACIIAATHDLWWAQRISTDTLLLMSGQVVFYGSTSSMLEKYGSLEKLFIQLASPGARGHATV